MRFKIAFVAVYLAATACSSSDDRARALLSKAETQCGLRQGTFQFLSVNDVYDDEAREPSGRKIIVVRSPNLGHHQSCVDGVAQSGGFDRVTRLVTYGFDPGK
jgi:hypothetical protein